MIDKYMMEGCKLAWHPYEVAKWASGILPAPITVEVSPTNICNHNCVFCGLDFARGKTSLDVEVLQAAFIDMADAGTKAVLISGEGEPFLHTGIVKIVNAAYDAGLDIGMATNGVYATGRVLNQIIDKLTWLRFSVDAGSGKGHIAKHRGNAGDYGKVVENAYLALKLRSKNSSTAIGIQYVLLNDNINEIKSFLDTFGEEFDYLSIKPFSCHPKSQNYCVVEYTEEGLLQLRELTKDRKNVVIRADSMTRYQKQKKTNRCLAMPFMGYIDAHGEFYTCMAGPDQRYAVGNINKQSIRDIYLSAAREAIIKEYRKFNSCTDCRVNCRATACNEYLEMIHNIPEHVNFI